MLKSHEEKYNFEENESKLVKFQKEKKRKKLIGNLLKNVQDRVNISVPVRKTN